MITMRHSVAVALMSVGLGCTGRAPAPVPEIAAPIAVPTRPDAEAPPPAAGEVANPPCDAPELWLAVHPRDQIAQRFCDACKDSCQRGDAGWTMPWEVLGTHGLESYACSEIEYAKLAVEAYSRRAVADPRWRAYLERQPWYEPPTARATDPLPAVAADNHAWLDDALKVCRGHEEQVSPGDVRVIDAWFAGLRKGSPILPSLIFVDGRPAGRAAFMEFLTTDGLFDYSPRTAMDYADDGPGAQAVKGKTRTVSASTGDPGIRCVGWGEPCEGFEWIEFTLDERGEILAIHIAAAACPFVDVALADGTWARQGEILRNLNAAHREATQALRLTVPDCRGSVRVRLTEEKDEVTFVDSVSLQVGSRRVTSHQCEAAAAAFCDDDGRYHRLRRGEALELTFDVESCDGPVRMIANGFYEPVAVPAAR